MAKTKRPKLELIRGGDEDITFNIPYNREQPQANLTYFGGYKFDHCEFAFQFDDDEPVVFATSNPTSYKQNLTISIDNTAHGNLQFTHNGRKFKIFARNAKKDNIA